ncbi:MAG: trimeric intracellular cation channel family protein, partial [Armatimonadetes bacterium]|nr:trimeric intracellular cation channel family protein [Armatimonadota bacterium]
MLLLTFLDYLGTFAFAVSGALKGVRRGMDLFGLTVLAVVTAIGGGTIRDVMLGQQPFWFHDSSYILLSLAAAFIVFGLYRVVTRGETLLLWFDAVGLGAFTVIGATKAMDAGLGAVGTIVLATLTGIGGGIIRDLLAGDVPVVLRKEVYASACIIGAALFWYLAQWHVSQAISMPVAML